LLEEPWINQCPIKMKVIECLWDIVLIVQGWPMAKNWDCQKTNTNAVLISTLACALSLIASILHFILEQTQKPLISATRKYHVFSK